MDHKVWHPLIRHGEGLNYSRGQHGVYYYLACMLPAGQQRVGQRPGAGEGVHQGEGDGGRQQQVGEGQAGEGAASTSDTQGEYLNIKMFLAVRISARRTTALITSTLVDTGILIYTL